MRISKAIKPASFPSTFGVLDREQKAYDFLLPYLQRETEDVELEVEVFIEGADAEYPLPVYAEYINPHIFMWIHVNPVAGEVIFSLKVLAHEIGHARTVDVAGFLIEDSEAQAKSVGKHLLRKWLGR